MADHLTNRGAVAPGRADVSGVELLTIWEVDENGDYDVDSRAVNNGAYIAIYTFSGSGRIDLQGRPTICTQPGHFLVIRRLDLMRYRTEGDRWHFWWFEFYAIGPVHFPLYSQVPVSIVEENRPLFDEAFAALRRDRLGDRRLASALFTSMLYRWLLDADLEPEQSPYDRQVRAAVDLMHDNLDGSLRLRDMARAAGMGERTFRTQFVRTMGVSPKRHYNCLRLEMARHLVELGAYQVGEIADRLGFSSPFHLSKSYRAQFGRPPSADLPRQ